MQSDGETRFIRGSNAFLGALVPWWFKFCLQFLHTSTLRAFPSVHFQKLRRVLNMFSPAVAVVTEVEAAAVRKAGARGDARRRTSPPRSSAPPGPTGHSTAGSVRECAD